MRRFLIAANALRFLDSFILIAPFYTVMFAERGLTPVQIGVALASWSLVGLVLEVPCGVLADQHSRRWLLCGALLLRCVGFLIWIAFPGFWGFLVGLMLWGMKSATLSGAFEALIYDELKAAGRETDYARVFGQTQAARFTGVLAASLGAAAISTLAPDIGYDSLIWASVVAGVAAAGAALLLPKAPQAVRAARRGYGAHLLQGVREAISLPGVPSLLAFIAATQAVVLANADYWQLFGRDVGLSKTGIALFMAAIYGVGAAMAAGAHRFRDLSPFTLYLVLIAAGGALALGAATYRSWSVGLVVVFVALYWLVEVNMDARFQHALKGETRATVASVKGFATQAGTSVLMLTFGVIAQISSYQASFFGAGLAVVLIGTGWALASWKLRRSPSPS